MQTQENITKTLNKSLGCIPVKISTDHNLYRYTILQFLFYEWKIDLKKETVAN